MSWDLDTGGKKTDFTKFPVGVTHIRVLDEAPHSRWTHWMNSVTEEGRGRGINCPGMAICPIDDIIDKQRANREDTTYGRTRKFAMNVYNYETGKNEVMEQGKTFMEDLKLVMEDVIEDGKVLSDVILRIRRTGTGKDDTSYRIDNKSDATEPIQTAGVIDLNEYFKPHSVEQVTRLLEGEKWETVMQDNSNNEQIEIS